MNEKNKLVLISGASGGIGRAYFNHYVGQEKIRCYGIGRRKSYNARHIQLDMLDSTATKNLINDIDFTDISEVLFIHGIGLNKFEQDGKPEIDNDGDGIDYEVYSSNVQTFLNFAEPLIYKSTETQKPVRIVNIGSISDVFMVPLWQSFSKSKNIMRQYLKSQTSPLIDSIFLNVSSMDMDHEKYGRPFADTTYWLKPEELCERSLPILNQKHPNIRYTEVDIFNPDPDHALDYFTNIPKLLTKWKKDMGYKEDERIPAGIRI